MGPAGQHETVVVIVVDQTGPAPSFLIVEGGEHVKPNGRDVENVSVFQAHAAATPGCSFSSNTHRSALQAALAPAGGAGGAATAATAAGAAVPANPTEALIDRIVTSIANSRSPSTKHKVTCAALVAIISSDPATAAAALATLIANLTSAAALAAPALAAGGGAPPALASGGAGGGAAAEHTVLLLAEEAFAQGRGDDAIATLVSAASAVHGGDLIKQSVVAAATACYRVKFVDGTDDNSRRGTQAGREALVEYDRLVALGMPPNDAAMATRLGRILCPRAVATYGCVKGEAVAGRPYYVEAERELFEEIGLDVRGAGALIAVTPTVFLLEGGPYHAQIDTVLTARCGRGPGLGSGGAAAAGGAGAVPIREGEVLSWEWMTGPTLSSSLNADTLSAFRALLNVFGINGIRRSLSKSPVPELATMFATATATPAAAGGAAGGAGAGGAAGATPPSAAKAAAGTYVPPHMRAGGAGGATPPSAAIAATPPSAAIAAATYVPPHMRAGAAGGAGGAGATPPSAAKAGAAGAGGRQAQGPRYGTGFGGSGGSGGSGSAKWGKPGPGPRRNSRSRTNRTNRTHSTRRKSRRNRTYRR